MTNATSSFIPVSEPQIGAAEAALVADCVESGWISSVGQYIEEFEKTWAAYCGRAHGVAVSSGTAALELTVAALGVGPGDEVIMPTFTIISCALALWRVGAKPVLVDSDPLTFCMDVEQIEAKVTSRTRAIMPVHIYGHPVDMGRVQDVAGRHDLLVIEDAAEAHGAEYRSRRCGSFGEASCFSFYANKIVTTGEGGMVVTDDSALAERCAAMRNLGFRRDRRFYHTEFGSNYRLTNLQAAIGVGQLRDIDRKVDRKRQVGTRYTSRLSDIDGLQLPIERAWAKNVYWMYGVLLDPRRGDAATFARRLAERGVDSRPFFLGMHEQPVFRDLGWFVGESYPVAEAASRQGLYLPSGVGLTDDQCDRVCETVRDILN
ncbi:MAG: DegT/DnrJ/EryC1/StrS family aminotransferase [Candidatus Dormibacteria bacterium]